jgi:site-specific recombinase
MKEKLYRYLQLIPTGSGVETHDYSWLRGLISILRPKSRKNFSTEVNRKFSLLNEIVMENPDIQQSLSYYIQELFRSHDPVPLFTETGILPATGFFYGFIKKLKHKILPDIHEGNDLRQLIDDVFDKKRDYRWLKAIDKEEFEKFVSLTGVLCDFAEKPMDNRNFVHLVSAIQILSHRIAALGTAPEILQKLPHLDNISSPFLKQNQLITLYIEQYKDSFTGMESHAESVKKLLYECEAEVDKIYANKNRYGVNLRQTHLIKRIRNQISRVILLIDLMYHTSRTGIRQQVSGFFISLVEASNKRYSIRKHINEYLDLLVFEVIEHAARAGRHYIADNAKEYYRFLKAALAGGIIVALFAALKVESYSWEMSPLTMALVNSLIYGAAFVAIHQTGSILATKLPAYTATRLAECIDPGSSEKVPLKKLIIMIVALFRSQFIAFVGNLTAAIIVAIGIALLWPQIFGLELTQTYTPQKMVDEIHIWKTPTLLFAALAGFFLFISGLVAGHYENKVVFARIPARIRSKGKKKGDFANRSYSRFASYIEKNLGGLSGNILPGFLFGFTPLIGYLFGFWLDIRHIAFSAANMGFAVIDDPGVFTTNVVIHSTLALFLIGLINFFVSFIFAMYLAIRSRNITFSATTRLGKQLLINFIKRPLAWFLPVKTYEQSGPPDR